MRDRQFGPLAPQQENPALQDKNPKKKAGLV
jgi:hypothetical protein